MSYWYIASPYSLYPYGLDAAHHAVCRETARLLRAGIPALSPIAHSHPVAVIGGLPLTDHDLWLGIDAAYMEAAKGCIIVMLPGWEVSRGVDFERIWFLKNKKPIIYMTPGEIPVELQLPTP